MDRHHKPEAPANQEKDPTVQPDIAPGEKAEKAETGRILRRESRRRGIRGPPRLTRRQLAGFLRRNGYPISLSYLEKMCAPAINQGPPTSCWWGNRPLYDPNEALKWAEGRVKYMPIPAE
jgi:hypothetical protein